MLQNPETVVGWLDKLDGLPGVELPQVIVFLLSNGWSTFMVNNYKSSDGWKLHDDGHILKITFKMILSFPNLSMI